MTKSVELGITTGERFRVGGQFLNTGLTCEVRVSGKGVLPLSDLKWLKKLYRETTETEYVCFGRDEEAGVLLAIGYHTCEIIVIKCCAVDGLNHGSCSCAPWSAVISRQIISPRKGKGGFRYRSIVHQDLLGRKIGDEVDMFVMSSEPFFTIAGAWHEALESARDSFFAQSLNARFADTEETNLDS